MYIKYHCVRDINRLQSSAISSVYGQLPQKMPTLAATPFQVHTLECLVDTQIDIYIHEYIHTYLIIHHTYQ